MKKLAISISGSPAWNRYLIVRNDGRFWNGKRWTRLRRRARLYARGQDVALAFRKLEERLYEDKPLRKFEVTMSVRVRADQDFDIKAISAYLHGAVSIMIDHDKGTGPVPDSLVQLDVTWAEMREVPPVNEGGKP
jgi:hypothetical protein